MNIFHSTILFLLLFLSGCSSVPNYQKQKPVTIDVDAINLCKKWTRNLPGRISNVSLSDNRQFVIVSTSGERIRYKGSTHYARLRLYSAKTGKLFWTKILKHPVRRQAISHNGKYIAANTYDGKLRLYSRKGRMLWAKHHMGVPYFSTEEKKLFILHDDDASPEVAYVAYDIKKGKQIAILKMKEPVEARMIRSKELFTFLLPDGALSIAESNGNLKWQTTVHEAAFSATFSQLDTQQLHVLTPDDLHSYSIQDDIDSKWSTNLGFKHQSVNAVENKILLYGNGPKGQALTAFDRETGKYLWHRYYRIPAEYTSKVFSNEIPKPSITVALDTGKKAGVLNLVAVSAEGTALWNIPINAKSGIYSYAVSQKKLGILVGTGKPRRGRIEFYQPCN